jgi:hypothetical protein
MNEKISQLLNLMEDITGQECDIEIINGKLLINITENKRDCIIPDDLKLPDMYELDSFHDFISRLPEKI